VFVSVLVFEAMVFPKDSWRNKVRVLEDLLPLQRLRVC
jgi:hypothetical protein